MSHQGKIAAQGAPGDLIKSGVDFVVHDANEKDTRADDENSMVGSEMCEDMSRKSSLRSSSTSNRLNRSTSSENDKDKQCHPESHLEESASETGSGSALINYFKSGAHSCILSLLFLSIVATQIVASASDIWISIWYLHFTYPH